jgi:carbonic anhydrase
MPIKTQLRAINSIKDIPAKYLGTSIEKLFEYQNFSEDFRKYENPELIVVMCMDNRKQLRIPNKFSYIIRTPGARILGFEFALSFPIAMADIKHVAVIAHTNCGMVNLVDKKNQVVNGLVKTAGWTHAEADNHFHSCAPLYSIENETTFVYEESLRLKVKYPNINFVPMLYKVEDHRLYLIEE